MWWKNISLNLITSYIAEAAWKKCQERESLEKKFECRSWSCSWKKQSVAEAISATTKFLPSSPGTDGYFHNLISGWAVNSNIIHDTKYSNYMYIIFMIFYHFILSLLSSWGIRLILIHWNTYVIHIFKSIKYELLTKKTWRYLSTQNV